MNNEEIKIFSPATIANVSCGFDVLGLALDTVGDEMIIRKVKEKGIKKKGILTDAEFKAIVQEIIA